ncbi:hypothetical protein AV530_017869 [Patagioenas fasciata monilis]|uniref:Ubiquitin carboxyl-terminal hydrolase 4 n=1 Tax=Patagioenas fasciata monilis TaxID=372326 RepID=A0A1V4JVL5_PATFA|nr:hypothetical protein AV530_017869 [Patagioenas fasciata monilis]
MSRYLENFSPPMVWSFTPEQLQDPVEVTEYVKEKCSSYSKEAQLTALCWALASIYQTLLNIMQCPQGEEREGKKPTGTAAASTLGPDAVAAHTPATGTVATQTQVAGAATESENQPVSVSVAPLQKKNYTKKSVGLVTEDDDPTPSQEQEEEEAEPEIVTRSLSPGEL